MVRSGILSLVLIASFCFPQSNTLRSICSGTSDIGARGSCAMLYLPDSNRFIMTHGALNGTANNRFDEIVLSLPDERWINFLPAQSLYGTWADSLGSPKPVYQPTFSGNALGTLGGYVRAPQGSHPYYWYAYNSDDKCIYYYIKNLTYRYNTSTRLWQSLSVATHPAKAASDKAFPLWGALCYDPINKEVLCFGGGNVDAPHGNFGTWVYKPETNVWSKLTLSVEPPPRAFSQMVYDAQNQVIVLFGGDHLDYQMADTWVYNCATRTWTDKQPAVSPPPRAGHALVYLPKARATVLIGGYIGYATYGGHGPGRSEKKDMWVYNVETNQWKLIKSFSSDSSFLVTSGTGWGWRVVAAADTADNIIVACRNGSAQILGTYLMACNPSLVDENGTQTSGVPNGTRTHETGPYSPAWYNAGVAAPNPDSVEAFLRGIPLNTWTRMTQPKVPERDCDPATYDWDNDQMLILGGGHNQWDATDMKHYNIHTNRWHISYEPEFPLDQWGVAGTGSLTNRWTFNNRPFMRGHQISMYQYLGAPIKRVISVGNGGYYYSYNPAPDKMEWDAIIPMPAELDFFCNPTVGTCPYGLFVWNCNYLYLVDSTLTFRKLQVNGEPLIASTLGACPCSEVAYDSKRNRMLMFPNDDPLRCVWTYDFSTSTLTKLPVSNRGSLPFAYGRRGIYLPAQDKFLEILYTEFHGTADFKYFLLYDCATNTWDSLRVSDPYNGYGVVTYDKNRDLLWRNSGWGFETDVMRLAGGVTPPPVYPGPGTAAERGRKGLAELGLSARPNPFNPAVTLTVTVQSNEPALVKIFDLQGRMIQTLTVGDASRGGQQSVVWNGANESGKAAASGIYLARLFAGSKAVSSLKIVKMD